jgi:hypothetical protein
MKLNSPEGEAYMQREAERRQAQRWEPEDDDTQDETIECAWCNCFMERDAGFTSVNGDECCSNTCRKKHTDDLLRGMGTQDDEEK